MSQPGALWLRVLSSQPLSCYQLARRRDYSKDNSDAEFGVSLNGLRRFQYLAAACNGNKISFTIATISSLSGTGEGGGGTS